MLGLSVLERQEYAVAIKELEKVNTFNNHCSPSSLHPTFISHYLSSS